FELRLARFVLVAFWPYALGDDLRQRFADEATTEEEQAADAVDECVARQQQPCIRGRHADGKTEAEGQNPVSGERVERPGPDGVVADLDPRQHGGGQERDVLRNACGAKAVVRHERWGYIEHDSADQGAPRWRR